MESSIDRFRDLTKEEKESLLGKTDVNLPRELKAIDEMINNRKLLISELNEHYNDND